MFAINVKSRVCELLFLPALMVFLGIVLSVTPVNVKAQGLALENCTGLHSTTWSPGVTNSPALHTVKTTSNWLCAGTGGELASVASSTNKFEATFACNGLLAPVDGLVWTINWNDSQPQPTSTFSFNVTVEAVGGNLVITSNNGKITAGRFKGDGALATFTLAGLAGLLQCNQPDGLTGAGGLSTLTITGL